MSSAPLGRAVYVPTASEPVFGMLHEPAGASSDTAVLISPPFGWEEMCSYRARRAWAAQLAADGHPALRIDLPSAGDSGGSPGDPDRLGAWTQAVASAVAWLRASTGSARVAVVGIGVGGAVALRAMADGAAIDDLVLWGVPARGKAIVRELRVFARLEGSRLAETGGDPAPPHPDGSVEAGGYVLSAETVAALEALDLTEITPPPAPARVLLLGRDDLPVDQRLREHAAAGGAHVEAEAGPGYGAMMAEPRLSIPPLATIARVGTWLAGAARPSAAGGPARGSAQAAGSAELDVDGATVREYAICAEATPAPLSAIVSEPVSVASLPVCVVWLNAGALRRTGPNRMWVEAARRWAARGLPSARFDLAGIGDADGLEDWGDDDGGFYRPVYREQLSAALDALEGRGVARRFVLAGLCSGAYWALEGAVHDERVVAAIMLNPRTLLWDPWVGTVRESRALLRLADPAMLRRVLRGEIALERVAAITKALLVRLAHAPARLPRAIAARLRARRAGGDELDASLDRLRDEGKRAVVMFSGAEPLHDELVRNGRLARASRWPNLRFELLGTRGDTHTLRPTAMQARAHAVIDRALEREAELAREAATGQTGSSSVEAPAAAGA